tara:strand:- start:1827 stop:2006 length:180 start_codon:yes stop_codon:yes gene_type:complete
MLKALLTSLIILSFGAAHPRDTNEQKSKPAFSFYKESDFSKLKKSKQCYEWRVIEADKN